MTDIWCDEHCINNPEGICELKEIHLTIDGKCTYYEEEE